MSSGKPNKMLRWRRRLAARLAKPQTLFLGPDGVQTVEGQVLPFADWCASHAGQAADVIVSARLLHELVCEPGLPLDDEAALQTYARQLFSHYFGAAAQRWPLAGWRAGSRRGAAALHGLDWAALQQATDEADVDLRSARPAWAPLLQRLAREQATAALAWVEGSLLSWVVLKAGDVAAVRQQRLVEPTLAALAETLNELRAADAVDAVTAAGYGLTGEASMPAQMQVLGRLDATQPELGLFAQATRTADRALPQPDFLAQRVRHSLLAWPLALTGLLVLATAGWSAVDSHRQHDEAQAGVDGLAARVAGRKPVAAAAPRITRTTTTADADRLRSAAEVQALLQQNWEPLLANVEEAGASLPAGQLSWLSLDYSAGRNELRLEGLVQDKAVALQLVDRLAAAPGWGNVVLSRFQNGEQGLVGQRFELGARLQTDRLKAELPAKEEHKPS
ncbi:hypothetical protein SNE35_30315 [Paucibacter sp. R3-3]|uniref:GspL cytoplasmic actin-ATPase-like domain-containing protein n=1 Tax=Roseateles agri TaxID=3098619 RepID=A0ABU5DR79_9BURK|nr:hypothetical protein [Paucibacter sp. R3-3]MDY0748832.1 hypothetical protein [Paucibacter sp. R3-3]